MSRLWVRNGHLITGTEERFVDIWTEDDFIGGLGECPGNYRELDATGCYVTPGLFDLQVNGGPECDFWADPDEPALEALSQRLVANGVTAILPTLITGDLAQTVSTRDKLSIWNARAGVSGRRLVRMPGIHLEGPCISSQQSGVHPKQHIQPLSFEVLKALLDGSVKLMTLAPELDVRGEHLDYLVEQGVCLSLGHSNATFEEAKRSFERGVQMVTHLFNALPGIHHRAPGPVTAALLDDRIYCCLICDGLHINPDAARLAVKCKGPGRTILVTDMAAVGTSQGGLVGSSILLAEAVRNVVRWGVADFADAIRMSTYNPARALGLEKLIGSLTAGAHADLVLWDKSTLEINQVIFSGQVQSKVFAAKPG